MSHVYGKGYYTSSSSSSSTNNQQQQQQSSSSFSFHSSGDDFEYDSSVLTSPGNKKRSHQDFQTCGKRLRLSNNLYSSNNSYDDDSGISLSEQNNYPEQNGNLYERRNKSYQQANYTNSFPQRRSNGYSSSNGLYHRRNEDVSNFPFDQEKNYNQEPFVDPQQKNRAPGPAHLLRLRHPEPSGMDQGRFDGHQPRGNHRPNQGLGPRADNGFPPRPFRHHDDRYQHQSGFNPGFQDRQHFPSGPNTFDNHPRLNNPDLGSLRRSEPRSGTVSPPKELVAPVFQTRDRVEADWGAVMAASSSRTRDKVDTITERSERSEQWAWGSGKKWDAPSVAKPKLNVYSAAPKADMFKEAARVSGGIGEKLLQKMGWNQGQGLGRTGHGSVNPIEFNEIKTDRRGLKSQEDAPKDASGSKVDQEEPEEESWEKVKSKFAVMKSSSFWGWHNSGMKGPDTIKGRIKVAKKEAKAKEPVKEVSLVGKHPVSCLVEVSHKRGWPEPRFTEERGPQGFRFRVEVNGQSYQPPEFSDNKKSAKKDAAQHCLVTMGLVPASTAS